MNEWEKLQEKWKEETERKFRKEARQEGRWEGSLIGIFGACIVLLFLHMCVF